MKKFKNHIKSYLAGILTTVLIISGTLVFAENIKIDAIFNKVKLVVDGNPVDKETLLYDGTTYIPIRAAAEVLGMEVGWDEETSTAYLNKEKSETKEHFGFGDTFTFDGLKITFINEPEWTNINNVYSSLNKAEVFKIPMILENVSEEKHNLNIYTYEQKSPKGEELDKFLSAYFKDDFSYLGKIQPGIRVNTYMYFLYDGDGEYILEFDKYPSNAKVSLNITKE